MIYPIGKITRTAQQGRVITSSTLVDMLKARGVTQAAVARVLRIDPSQISQMYSGKRQIKLDEAKKLIEAFGLDESQAAPPINEQTARLLVLHVANRLRVPLPPEDNRVRELALDFQAFSKFARAHLPAPSPDAASGFLEALRSDRAPQRAE